MNDESDSTCDRCTVNLAEDLHPCPYAQDIEIEFEFKCNCCESCIEICADDI